jgi:hypothetical protein
MLASLILASSAIPSCQPDIETLVPSHYEYVLLGELHGTKEIPEYFELVVRRALHSRREAVAAMELPDALNLPLDTFISSDMDKKDKKKFISSLRAFGSSDGRTSHAMINVILSLAKLAKENRDFSLRFVVPSMSDDGAEKYSVRLARNIVTASAGKLVIALVGNAHAAKSSVISNTGETPAGGLLPPRSTLTVLVRTAGGEAWNCVGSKPCGVFSNPTEKLDCGASKTDGTLSKWFDLYVNLNVRTNASKPYFPVKSD